MLKEKRFIISMCNYLAHTLVHSIFLIYFFFIFQHFDVVQDVSISGYSLAALIVIIFLLFVISVSFKKMMLFFKRSKVGLIIAFLFLVSLEITSSYLIYSAIITPVDNNFIKEFYVAVFLVGMLFSLFMITPVSKVILKLNNVQFNFYIMKDAKWYIYHPVNKQLILLGNHVDQSQSSESIMLPLDELRKEVIYHEKEEDVKRD